MKIDLGKTLAGLKHSLQTATDFLQPWERFHDEVAMCPIFAVIGQREENSRIVLALETGAAHLLRRRVRAVDLNFIHIAEHHFWHGHCQIGPRTVIFCFFDDVRGRRRQLHPHRDLRYFLHRHRHHGRAGVVISGLGVTLSAAKRHDPKRRSSHAGTPP